MNDGKGTKRERRLVLGHYGISVAVDGGPVVHLTLSLTSGAWSFHEFERLAGVETVAGGALPRNQMMLSARNSR